MNQSFISFNRLDTLHGNSVSSSLACSDLYWVHYQSCPYSCIRKVIYITQFFFFFGVVHFSYVSLSLHVHFPSNTDKSQGNRVEQVPPNCAIAACAPVSLNNSPPRGLPPTTFSSVSEVAVNSQALLRTPHQAGHTAFPLLISDLLRVHLPSYLEVNQPSFPPPPNASCQRRNSFSWWTPNTQT